MLLRDGILTGFWVFVLSGFMVSTGCQTQRPTLNETQGTSIAGSSDTRTVDATDGLGTGAGGTAAKGIESQGMDVVSTPFGLIKVNRKGRDSLLSENLTFEKSAHPDVSKGGESPTESKGMTSESDLQSSRSKDDEISADVKGKEEFLLHKVQSEEPSIPEVTPGEIALNFDGADLSEVIRAVAEILKINYIADPAVRGNVTIHTTGVLKVSDLFEVFLQILEMNGFTAVESGNLYKIVPSKNVSKTAVAYSSNRKTIEALQPREQFVMQIIPLKFISASEMSKVLAPFISSEGTIVTHDHSNILIIVDRGINILKALRLVDTFDIDLFKNFAHQWFSIRYVDAEEMVKLLNSVLIAYGKDEKRDFQLIPIKRLNRVIAVSGDEELLQKMEAFVQEFDRPDKSAEPRIYVYFMKNGQAEEFAGILTSIFSATSTTEKKTVTPKETEKAEESPYRPPSPFETRKKEPSATPAPGISGGSVQGSGTLRGTLKITADIVRNALIIEAIPSDYRIVEDILNQLDVLPRQVLIEVVIAEVTVDAKKELGVNWDYQYNKGDGRLTLDSLAATMEGSGIAFAIGQTARWSANLSALAQDRNTNILSAPIVLASDNKEARIDISDQIPVASAEYVYTGDSGVTQTNIQYRDTGIILTVTPHINERGLVSMDIVQEVSEPGADTLVGGKSYPSFQQRKVATSLTVGNGQTIVMGGLMRDTKLKSDSGVPFFSSVPMLGFLFGKESDERRKTELLLFITPRVIINLADVDEITAEFKSKVRNQPFFKERVGHY